MQMVSEAIVIVTVMTVGHGDKGLLFPNRSLPKLPARDRSGYHSPTISTSCRLHKTSNLSTRVLDKPLRQCVG